jgi:hypothetical protein
MNFGQTNHLGKKVWCYWERLGEQLGNPWWTLWEHIGNMMGTSVKSKKIPSPTSHKENN